LHIIRQKGLFQVSLLQHDLASNDKKQKLCTFSEMYKHTEAPNIHWNDAEQKCFCV